MTPRHKAFSKSRLVALAFFISTNCATALAAEKKPLHVFAAASLAATMQPISQAYSEKYHQEIKLSFGASSTLSRQIGYGAPAQVFISANPRWMQTLVDSDLTTAEATQDLLHNALLLVAPASTPIKSNNTLPNAKILAGWLQNQRLAVGDPLHVPVGIYAMQALKAAGLWQSVQHRLAPTEDARASLALLQRGEVALGIVYRSDLKAVPALRPIAELTMPKGIKISYPAAVIGDDPDGDAKQFLDFLRSEQASKHFIEMGFSPAG